MRCSQFGTASRNRYDPTQESPGAKTPTYPLGPVAAMVRSVIDRIGEIARAIGPYEAFITLMTIAGMIGLYYAKDPWPIVSLIVFGVTASLGLQGGASDRTSN